MEVGLSAEIEDKTDGHVCSYQLHLGVVCVSVGLSRHEQHNVITVLVKKGSELHMYTLQSFVSSVCS